MAICAVLMCAWYWLCAYLNRRRAAQILKSVGRLLGGSGNVAGVRWFSPSRFMILLALHDNCFRQPRMLIRLAPREQPISWLASLFRHSDETVRFEANLPCPPAFTLEVGSRHCAIRRLPFLRDSRKWQIERLGPFLIASRREWQRDLINVVDSLVNLRANDDLISVEFRTSSPHFSAIAPLRALKPSSHDSFFALLRAVAAQASAPRH